MRTLILSLLVILFICGCGGGGSNILNPDETVQDEASRSGVEQSSHALWGLWQFTAEPVKQTLDVVPLRSGDMHLNALYFLEPPPLVNLTVESVKFNGNIIDADIGLTHPFTNTIEFTGFDVCGIFITNGSITGFSDPDLRMAGEGDTRLLNPDGYSRWWNPVEFPVNPGTWRGYKDGLLGIPDSTGNYNSTLNAYKYFCDGLGANDPLSKVYTSSRGKFSVGSKRTRHYTIELGTGGLTFNYAVDACWKLPTGSPPYTAPGSFPPGANRPEAWRIIVTELENTLYNNGTEFGGNLILSIDVYDWFNAGLNKIKVESPGHFAPVTSAAPIGGGTSYSTYEVEILDATPSEGSIDLFISVGSEAVGYGNLLPGKPVTAYFMHTSAVTVEAQYTYAWARTWGGSQEDTGRSVAVDSAGNVYVTGRFSNIVDLDTSPGEDWHTSNGYSDIFLSKFDSSGAFLWAKTWGSSYEDYGRDVAVDASGNVYVAGFFEVTADFDPGPGEDWHTADGRYIFLSKFDPSGAFLWAKTWGGNWSNQGNGVVVDISGNVYVTGWFFGTADFDPGPGEDLHISNGGIDIFLSRFDSSGAFIWAKTWGTSVGADNGPDWGLDVTTDILGNAYVTGSFYGTADFDPGTGEDWHNLNGIYDVFLSKFDSSGTFLWAKTWGGETNNVGYNAAVDISGNVYVTGYFYGTADFDPGPGVDLHISISGNNIFLSKFDSSGEFMWAKTWDASCGYGVAVDPSGDVFVTGPFSGTVDFDPGPGENWHTPHGATDAFLSKFAPSGGLLWVNNWGGSKASGLGLGVVLDVSGNVYVTGQFAKTVDFDPAIGEDWHASNGNHDVFLSKFSP